MAYRNNNDFTDWLYNAYVVAIRRNDTKRALVFLDVLNQYVFRVLAKRKSGKRKRHAKELLKTVQKAAKNGTTHKLVLTGEEGLREFEAAMAKYEKALREMGLGEETITELVNEKKMEYGND